MIKAATRQVITDLPYEHLRSFSGLDFLIIVDTTVGAVGLCITKLPLAKTDLLDLQKTDCIVNILF